MTKDEFLEILRISLTEEMSIDKVNENIKYYDEYISENETKDKSDDEIFSELGDPRLIAKTIIDTYKLSKNYQYSYKAKAGHFDQGMNEEARQNYEDYQTDEKGENNRSNQRGSNIIFNTSKMPWYQKALGILVLIIILFVMITLGGIAIKLLFTFAVPIIVMILLFKIIGSIFRRW